MPDILKIRRRHEIFGLTCTSVSLYCLCLDRTAGTGSALQSGSGSGMNSANHTGCHDMTGHHMVQACTPPGRKIISRIVLLGLLLATSFVHFTHTCTSEDSPILHSLVSFVGHQDQQDPSSPKHESGETCPACAFLHAMHSAKISVYLFPPSDPSPVPTVREAGTESSPSRNFAHSNRVRAPPVSL